MIHYSLLEQKIIKSWKSTGANAIKRGKITFQDGYIYISVSGYYYVYCQVSQDLSLFSHFMMDVMNDVQRQQNSANM